MSLPNYSANELRKASKGKVLSKIWLPAGEFFSFFEFYFDARKDASPEVKGSWMIGSVEIRKYIFTFTDFFALRAEIDYVCSEPGSTSEIELDAVYESRCLRSLQEWEGPMRVVVSSTETQLKLEFIAHALASSEIVTFRPELFRQFVNTVFNNWCQTIITFKLQSLWFLPLGGSYSVFDNEEKEHAVISADDIFQIREFFDAWDGMSVSTKSFASIVIKLNEDDVQFSIYDVSLVLTFREFEALIHFLLSRLFLSENGSFAQWRDKLLQLKQT